MSPTPIAGRIFGHVIKNNCLIPVTARLFVVALLLTCAACKTGQQTAANSKSIAVENRTLEKDERKLFLADLAKNYPPYTQLSVNFTLKGKIENQEQYFQGSIQSTPDLLEITMTDAVFLSPLITLKIGKERVTLKDHARNKTETLPRAEYQWVELFGRYFPVVFFEPLMRGFFPVIFTSDETKLSQTPAGEIQLRGETAVFEFAGYCNNKRLEKLFYRDKAKNDVIAFQMGKFFEDRPYPQALKIELVNKDDFLTMNFKNLKVK